MPHKAKTLKVNLGCGSHIEKGKEWLNIDNFYLPEVKNFLKGDAKEIPLESNSVDYLICDQMLEHIPMADVPIVLYEIRRVLKKGGRAVIIVPDFEDAVKAWLDAGHNSAFDPAKYKYFSEVVYGNQLHEGEFHKTPMCAGYLFFMLNMVGLKKHQIIFAPRNGLIPEYEGMRPYSKTAVLRNAQLIADITKD